MLLLSRSRVTDPTRYRQLADAREWYGRIYKAAPCYRYQEEVLLAYEQAVDEATSGAPDPLEVVCNPQSRQSGKNTSSARWNVRKGLKYGYLARMRKLRRLLFAQSIKTAPTYKPQVVVSMQRLEAELDSLPLTRGKWARHNGYKYTFTGLSFSQTFLSAGPTASRVGETASLDLEIDEAQRTSKAVFDRDLSPMRGSTNAPAFFQGTELDDQTLLAHMMDYAGSLQAKDGKRRIFAVDWQRAAEENENYGRFCLRERERLGADSVVWLTEYCLVRVTPEDIFCTPADLGRLQAGELRRARRAGKIYVGAVDFCGAAEEATDSVWDTERTKRWDMTVFTVGELEWKVDHVDDDGNEERSPVIQTADIQCHPGRVPEDLVNDMSRYFFQTWACVMVCGDKNGVGDGPCASMEVRYPGQFVGVYSTEESMDRMGHRLMSAIKSGRFHLFREEKRSPELEEAVKQFTHLRRRIRRNKITGKVTKMWWGHPAQQVVYNGDLQPIHDDIPKACGLLMEAAYRAELPARHAPSAPAPYVPWNNAAGFDDFDSTAEEITPGDIAILVAGPGGF